MTAKCQVGAERKPRSDTGSTTGLCKTKGLEKSEVEDPTKPVKTLSTMHSPLHKCLGGGRL